MALLKQSDPLSHRVTAPAARGAAACVCSCLLAGCLLLGAATSALAQEPSEEQVKAAFLVNFPKYIDWPADSFGATNSHIVLLVVGDRVVAEEARKMVTGKSVNGRPFAVREVESANEVDALCAIMFVRSEERNVSRIFAELKDASVLTVGESDDFLERGGMINLARRDRKVRLEVNLEAARERRLRISSKLLSVADVVRGKTN